ncbi:snoRNA-binding rRNA-processing protein NOP14 [Aspergillus foveolatus]|uniref:snoRNA-binding rRNA-processing protein NOP14 n=1 Tax=Aspergillus foveolatus TaxID=210207 RepID=UPI003CCCBC88
MPPSQLKQLKASLRDTGLLGPQKSKKQKRQNAKTGANAQNRAQRETALNAIRERFNPFEIRTVTRGKFDVTTRDGGAKSVSGNFRPGVTKSLGEERRRQTLLQEMDRRNKVGGIMDRRFGENDPTMTPEERAAERFARASQKKLRKDSMFNLEEDDEEEFTLTHKGESLSFGDEDGIRDDFQEDLDADDMSDAEMPRKRKRFIDDPEAEEGGSQDGEDVPERKKSKHEVMQEVIAKSKFYKAQRQMAKEDDDDLREELDKGLPELFDMLRGVQPPPKPEPPKDDLAGMNPDRAAIMQGHSQGDPEKEYDQRLKQLTFDKRSMPTDRTKTEEEKAEEEAQRLKKLEEERIRRMRGEDVSEDDAEAAEEEEDGEESEEESLPDDAKDFGLQQPTNYSTSRPEGVDDEDDFILDDLVETRSDVSLSFVEDDEDIIGSEEESEEEEEEEDELINGITMPGEESGNAAPAPDAQIVGDGLAYTYPCPNSHEEFLETIKNISYEDLPTVIQRIRALHHPRLHSDNKAKLGQFAGILVQHAAYMVEQPQRPPFAIVENVLRHIHSLAKSHPESVSLAFRAQLREVAADRPLSLRPGDLVILTGIATIYPTSDHFHSVSTPAHLCLARYLGQGPVNSLSDLCTGTYAASLALQYQAISRRYIPEFLNYVLNALCILSPGEPSSNLGSFPLRQPTEPLRLRPSKPLNTRKLQFLDVPARSEVDSEELKLSLITTLSSLLNTASDLWSSKSASVEIFNQAQAVLQHVSRSCVDVNKKAKKAKNPLIPAAALDTLQYTLDKLSTVLSQSRLTRRPLLLHNHRPLAVKTAIPKFEDSFNPDKHYDPNRERAEVNRLKAEYKRERKGAMRELRKDANFIAREKLREKKEKDAEYERKYKRLVAEVQNEEGREANAYEREKRMRQGKR